MFMSADMNANYTQSGLVDNVIHSARAVGNTGRRGLTNAAHDSRIWWRRHLYSVNANGVAVPLSVVVHSGAAKMWAVHI